MKILVVPTWLEYLVTRGPLDWHTVADLSTLRRHLPLADLATYTVANRHFLTQYPELAALNEWRLEHGLQLEDSEQDTFAAYLIEQRTRRLVDLLTDLPGETQVKLSYTVSLPVDNTLVVTVNVVEKNHAIEEPQHLYDQCLRLLYAHQPFEVVSATSLFSKYLQLI